MYKDFIFTNVHVEQLKYDKEKGCSKTKENTEFLSAVTFFFAFSLLIFGC